KPGGTEMTKRLLTTVCFCVSALAFLSTAEAKQTRHSNGQNIITVPKCPTPRLYDAANGATRGPATVIMDDHGCAIGIVKGLIPAGAKPGEPSSITNAPTKWETTKEEPATAPEPPPPVVVTPPVTTVETSIELPASDQASSSENWVAQIIGDTNL